jgi:S1-C subfamily serine protease
MWLQVRSGPDAGTAVELPPGRPFVLGRQQGCDLVVRDPRASRRHAELSPLSDGRVRLRDLESANGTVLDGRPVTEALLEGGEDLRIGDVVIAVLRGPPGRTGDGAPAGEPTQVGERAATPSMVRRLVEQRTRRASLVAVAAAVLAAVAVVIVLVAGGGGNSAAERVPGVVAALAPSTVLVITERDGTRTGSGSGWVLDAGAGLVATAAHVVNQGEAFRVVSGGRSRAARVVSASPCEDLALLRVADRAGLKTMPLGSSAGVRQGETVVALGYPADAAAGDPAGSTTGVVSVVHTTFRDPAPDVPAYPEVVQTDTPLNPGESGGPLADLGGRLIGVDAAARTRGSDGRPLQGINYAVAVDRARRVLAGLQAGRAAGWSGLTFGYPSAASLRADRLPPGLRVTGAIPGTPAARARIPRGALIAAVDGVRLQPALRSWCAAVRGRSTGDGVVLSLAAPGARRTRQVSLRLG